MLVISLENFHSFLNFNYLRGKSFYCVDINSNWSGCCFQRHQAALVLKASLLVVALPSAAALPSGSVQGCGSVCVLRRQCASSSSHCLIKQIGSKY